MGWVFFAVALSAMLGFWLFMRTPAKDLAFAIRTFIAVFGTMASSGLIAFGRYGLALIVIVATFMTIRSLINHRKATSRFGEHQTSQSESRIETEFLSMSMDTFSGNVDGKVLKGPFKDKYLSELAPADLFQLHQVLSDHDLQSTRLLEAYLDRVDTSWRDRFSKFSEHHSSEERWHNDHDSEHANRPTNTDTVMTDERARAVLGIDKDAGPEDIKRAHLKLMKLAHPDHGGSDELARLINASRDFLIKKHTPGS